MDILQYTPDLQAPLTQFYNRLTSDVPPLLPREGGGICTGDARCYRRNC